MYSRQPVFLRLLVCALACALPSPVSAQQETASLTGTVQDESGAIVQKAVVTLTNVHTNAIATTETDESGRYRFASLRPGEYSGGVEHAGFSRAVLDGLTLQVADVKAIDVILETGQVTESVQVDARPSLLDTQTSSRGR